jgi:hypothetical protein
MKTPESSKENPSAPDSANSIPMKLTPRQMRVLQALLERAGLVSREQIDRIAGASNGPQIIQEVRQKVTGYDGLQMVRRDSVDRDGKPCKPGWYYLTDVGRARANKVVKHGAR